ncbi:MAG TPA: hypothetical protein VK611_24880 [Acidimicrobiales bacterium]|nr:hypothetical protein [Acidimicrobiales bacterium]
MADEYGITPVGDDTSYAAERAEQAAAGPSVGPAVSQSIEHSDTGLSTASTTVSYRSLAAALLAAPHPVTAIAHELGDQAGRLNAIVRRLDHLEARLNQRQAADPAGGATARKDENDG